MVIETLDHLVLTALHLESTCQFYEKIGFSKERFGNERIALKFGKQKINVHQYKKEFEPKAKIPTPGSQDLCFVVSTPINDVIKTLIESGIEIIEGPVERTGATSKLISVYIRDPDGNLLEFSNVVVE
ncbi:MAG: VOC family protein [Chlamydiota bacterium]